MTLPAALGAGAFSSEVTSSSSRPCGSSSQSSSLRSSPSSPSSLSWPCCPPMCEMALIAACTRGSRCTPSRIHQRDKKNSVSLKEVLTSERACASRRRRARATRHTQAIALGTCRIDVGGNRDCRKTLCWKLFSEFSVCTHSTRWSMQRLACER